MISIIVPIYNEEKAIRNTIARLKKIATKLGECEIIAVNDGSKDNTKSILHNIEGIRVLSSPYNLGYGASIKKGMREARGEWIAITDADGTYPLEELPVLAKHIPQYDMVVGARTGKKVHIPFFRKPAKWIIGKLANFMAGRKIDDVNSGLRIFNRQKALEFLKLYPSGFSFTTTITLAFVTSDYTINYLPINYFKRQGTSTIKPVRDFIGFITLIFRIIMYFRPLKFFLIPATIFLLIGIAYGAYQILQYDTGLGDLPVLLLIIGIQTMLMGFLADSLSKK